MVNKNLVEAKKLYEVLKDFMEKPQSKSHWKNSSVQRVMDTEILRFMLFIADAKGDITQRDTNIINYMLGTAHDSEKLTKFMSKRRNKKYYVRKMPEVPTFATAVCDVENAILREGNKVYTSFMNLVIDFFRLLGCVIIYSENDPLKESFERYEEYIEALQDYAKENTKSPFYNSYVKVESGSGKCGTCSK